MTGIKVPSGHDMREIFHRYDYILLFIALFLAYTTVSNINFPSGDVAPASFMPESLILHQNLYFDYVPPILSNPDYTYAFTMVQGHRVSLFPVVTGVLVTPIYAASHQMSLALSTPLETTDVYVLAKVSAAAIAATAGVLVFAVGKRLFNRKVALATALIFAFATSTWSISSQALWQQGTVELLLVLLIWLVMRNEETGWWGYSVLLGIVSGLFVFNRPPDAILLIPVIVWMVWQHRQQLPGYAAGAVLGGFPFFWYNYSVFGNLFGGYSANLQFFILNTDFISHYLGLLIAPNIGLLVFCPVLVLSLFGYLRVYRDRTRPLRLFLLLFGPAVLLQILLYSFFGLWSSSAAYCFGPRFLTGCVPVLCLYTGFFLDCFFPGDTGAGSDPAGSWKRQAVTLIVGGLVAVSVVIQFIGVFFYPWYMVKTMNDERAWDISDSIIVQSLAWGPFSIEGIEWLAPPPLHPLVLFRFSPLNYGYG
ncbi:MAG: glycosyltransferase family 39 protein [Methanoregula sp.]|uniref:glycosyltransferase family 39 protein n=1 Tax=Methanoregula sp. TaxID=2052170 RepID=UPI0025EF1AD1|nr:glycosyltransferase family 39 protein [Methanoregula sp.]MCK9630603.1 glycosyltransferase family 39 protein [Methanoregula sp.]